MNAIDFYVALRPLAEERLRNLSKAKEPELARLSIDSVEVEETEPDGVHIAVVFRDSSRPECRFGWRWSWAEGPKDEEVDFAADVLVTNLEEDILADGYGLPSECAPDAITWF